VSEPGAKRIYTIYRIPPFLLVGKTASGENGQNDGGLVRGKSIGNFAEAQAKSKRQ
jgi:hypothetical protein